MNKNKRSNIKLYTTLKGLKIRVLEGNVPRLVATTHRGDRKFLGDNVISKG